MRRRRAASDVASTLGIADRSAALGGGDTLGSRMKQALGCGGCNV